MIHRSLKLIACITLGCMMPLRAAIDLEAVTDPLNTYYAPVGKPAGTTAPATVTLTLLKGEVGLAAFSLYNPTPKTAYCKVWLQGVDQEACIIREAAHIRARLGQLPADVLPRITPRNLVVIPPGENRQLFLECRTRKSRPGTYRGTLMVHALEDTHAQTATVHVTVLPRELPTRHPLNVMTWDCSLRRAQRPKQQQALLAELTEHYVNNFHVLETVTWSADRQGNLNPKMDFSRLDKMLELLKGKGRLLLRCARPNSQAPNILTPEGMRAYQEFYARLARHLSQKGLDYQDYALYPLDENTGPAFIALATAIRKADPKIMIYADPDRHEDEINHVAGQLRLIDYMQVNNGFTTRPQAMEIIRNARKNLTVLSIYWCPVIQKRLLPQWYRQMAHLAWRLNLEGVGYWTSLWLQDNPRWPAGWDDFSGKNASPVTVYPARHDRNIPSRRWKAFRAGLEDWLVLDMVRKDGNKTLAEELNRALDPQTGSHDTFLSARSKAIRQLGGDSRED